MALPFAAFGWKTCRPNRHREVYHAPTFCEYRRVLMEALESQELSHVIAAVKSEAGWKYPSRYYESVLHLAVKRRYDEPDEQKKIISILDWFIKQKKFNIDIKSNRGGKTALHIAVRNGMIDVVDYLIHQGADLNARDDRRNGIIHHMVDGEYERYYQKCKTTLSIDELRRCHRESVHFFGRMFAKKIKIDITNKNGDTALQIAIKRNLLHVLPILLENAPNISYRDINNKTILHLFVEQFNSINYTDPTKHHRMLNISSSGYDKALIVDILKMMLSKGYSVSAVDDKGNTPLHSAAYRDWPDVTEFLLEDFKQVDICNNDGNTILHIVISNCIDRTNRKHKVESIKLVRMLLSKGADINKPNNDGYKPIHLAVMRVYPTILQDLKNHGAKKESYNGGNLLHLLCLKSTKIINASKLEDVIGLLVSEGCDVNAKDKDGMTPMHLAVESKRNSIIVGLIKCHANVDARALNPSRLTPLQMAVVNNYDYSIGTLIDFGADINAKDSSGKTALHMAMKHENDMVLNLLKLKAHVDIQDDQELLPLHYALRNQNRVALEELLKYGADINDIGTYQELLSQTDPGIVFFCIIEHWIKMKAAGLTVAPVYKRPASDDTFRQLHQDCLREVENLKSYKIGNCTTLYDLLHMDWNFRCAYTVNKSFKELINSKILQTKFPIYHVLILASYHDAVARQPLLEPAKRAWCEFTKILLPDVCVYRILAHLNNRELRLMVDGLKDRSFRKPCNLLLNTSWRRGFD